MPELGELHRLLDRYNESDPIGHESICDQIHAKFGLHRAVLTLDMSGFTRLVAQHGIVHYLALIRRMQCVTEGIVSSLRGTIAKYEADNLFALFEDPNDAVAAALSIRRHLARDNEAQPEERRIRVGIGIACGEVLKIGDHDIWGLAVNLASKLGEDTAKANEILLDPTAQQALTESTDFRLAPHAEGERRLGRPVYAVIPRGAAAP